MTSTSPLPEQLCSFLVEPGTSLVVALKQEFCAHTDQGGSEQGRVAQFP